MTETVDIGKLKISQELYDLVDKDIIPGTDVETKQFFLALGDVVSRLGPRNESLLNKRDEFQRKIDEYFSTKGEFDAADYEEFLRDIGYIIPEGEAFQVGTQNVDPEIAEIAGPQLVVPVDNPRFALNAANARWCSLYNALYGDPRYNNVIDDKGGKGFTSGYNPKRGAAVIGKANEFLDEVLSLHTDSWSDVVGFSHNDGDLVAELEDATQTRLASPEKFVGFSLGSDDSPASFLFKNNGLHIEIQLDPFSEVGKQHKAGIKDVVLESAITTIQDLEDSVSSVDVEDKVKGYRDWNGLMQMTLADTFQKGDKQVTRRLNPDRKYKAPDGGEFILPGRSMLLVRNAGMHLYTEAVRYENEPIPEGFLDAMVTALAAIHDLESGNNSKTGSVYIVKPKQHGPEEVAATVELFTMVEELLGLKHNTLKIGIMDEEQRTSVNLKECIRVASERVIFINTGFLDRTGDLIHTAMNAGPMETKPNIQKGSWLQAYERNNIQVGLETGLYKVGQIGKGMWAQNRNSLGLLETKIGHLKAGADCAWVPSPTFATLHAMHYHQVCVREVQEKLLSGGNEAVEKREILELPLLRGELWREDKERLIDSYAQSILGYVVRWVNQGVGCSSVPDIDDIYLMEDCATLRIGSQLLANWLKHGVVTEDEIKESFDRMAPKVDAQNKDDPEYQPLVENFDAPAYQTALELVFKGVEAPNGYVEHSLYKGRKEAKALKNSG